MTDVPEPTDKYKKHPAGWLAPDGKYYPCAGAAEHFALAYSLLKKFHRGVYLREERSEHCRVDDALQKLGWIRVGAMLSYNFGFIIWKEPTQRQVDVIWDYCRKNRSPMPILEVR